MKNHPSKRMLSAIPRFPKVHRYSSSINWHRVFRCLALLNSDNGTLIQSLFPTRPFRESISHHRRQRGNRLSNSPLTSPKQGDSLHWLPLGGQRPSSNILHLYSRPRREAAYPYPRPYGSLDRCRGRQILLFQGTKPSRPYKQCRHHGRPIRDIQGWS